MLCQLKSFEIPLFVKERRSNISLGSMEEFRSSADNPGHPGDDVLPCIKTEIKTEYYTFEDDMVDFLESHNCVDCGNSYSSYLALQDHTRQEHTKTERDYENSEEPVDYLKIGHETDFELFPIEPQAGVVLLHEQSGGTDIKNFHLDSTDKFTIESEHKVSKISSSQKTKYKCEVCSKVLSARHVLLNHRKIHEPKCFECDICHKKFTYKPTLKVHLMGVHFKDEFAWEKRRQQSECHICHKSIRTYALNQHILIQHENQHPFHCDVCDQDFRYVGDLKRHIESIHLKQKPHECEVCHKSFARQWDLKNHREIHQNLTFSCDQCNSKFNQSKSLRNHILQYHKRKLNLTCDFCGKTFTNSETYRQHYKAHTNPFKCDLCTKTFSRLNRYQAHIAKSCRSLKYTCDNCKEIFTTKKQIMEHLRWKRCYVQREEPFSDNDSILYID